MACTELGIRNRLVSAPRFQLHSELFFSGLKFRREFRPEVGGIEDLADFEFGIRGHRIGAFLRPLDRVFERIHFPDPKASYKFFGFSERAVDDGALVTGESDAKSSRGGMESVSAYQDSSLMEHSL